MEDGIGVEGLRREPEVAMVDPEVVVRMRVLSGLALQGKYMSALRGLSKADQAEVKEIRAEQGVEEAALKAAAAKAS